MLWQAVGAPIQLSKVELISKVTNCQFYKSRVPVLIILFLFSLNYRELQQSCPLKTSLVLAMKCVVATL